MTERKGFPRGCMIAIVIAGLAIALLVVFFVIFGREILDFSLKFVVASTEEFVVAAEPNGMAAEEIQAVYENFDKAIDSNYVTAEETKIVMTSAQTIVSKKSASSAEAKEFLRLLKMVAEPGEMSLNKERHGGADIGDSLVPALDTL